LIKLIDGSLEAREWVEHRDQFIRCQRS